MKVKNIIAVYIFIIITMISLINKPVFAENSKSDKKRKAYSIGVSILPPLSIFDSSKNKFLQINILYGKAYSVTGLNVGLLYNELNDNMHGFQFGMINFVHDNVNGIQLGGLLNITDNINGIQIAGVSNHTDNVSGFQFSLLGNWVSWDMYGVQFGLLYNVVGTTKGFQIGALNLNGMFSGFQIGIISNYASYKSEGFQLAGLININGEEDDAFRSLYSIAGLSNITLSNFSGFQLSSLFNYIRGGKGVLVTPGVNLSRNAFNGLTFAGIGNVSKKYSGMQIALGFNLSEKLSGLQVGFLNNNKEINGVQIGVINKTDHLNGVQLGLFNIVTEGFLPFVPIINISFSGNRLYMHNAAKSFDLKKVNDLIRSGYSPAMKDSKAETALHAICKLGYKKNQNKIVAILLKNGLNINEKNYVNDTPLHYAIAAGNEPLVKILLKNGADIEAKNAFNLTPFSLFHQYKGNKISLKQLLLSKGAKQAKFIQPWTIVQLSLFYPYQIFGVYNSVYGLRINTFYSYNHAVYGVDIGLFNRSSDFVGIGIGLYNSVQYTDSLISSKYLQTKQDVGLNGIQVGILGNYIIGYNKNNNTSNGFFQLGGLFNSTGVRDFVGIQIAGLTNLNVEDFIGLQLAAFNANDAMTGIQVGLANFNDGEFFGFQLGPIFNYNTDDSQGVMLTAVLNWVKDDFSGLQFGLINAAEDMNGFQISCLFNFASDKLNGAQIGFINVSDETNGVQFGILYNYSDDDLTGFQFGLVNYVEDKVYGGQFLGIVNNSDEFVYGVQAGIINMADTIIGTQIGLINVAKKVQGTQIGIINYCNKMSGIQLGAINFITEGLLPVFPIVNASMTF